MAALAVVVLGNFLAGLLHDVTYMQRSCETCWRNVGATAVACRLLCSVLQTPHELSAADDGSPAVTSDL